MIREVDLVSYLPEFMQSYNEPVEALKVENPEFAIMWKAVDRVLCNRFIATADEYGISRFERILNIHPSDEDTLESRRSRVQSKWFNKIPYTMKVLLQKLSVLCNKTDFTLTNNFTEGYTLTLHTNLELFGQVEELENIMNSMTPCNLVIDSKNSIPCEAKGTVFLGGGMVFVNGFTITNDFKETYTTKGNVTLAGGVVNVEGVQVTDAFKETIQADGKTTLGGGLVHTEMLQISQDFNETYCSKGSLNTGGGVVHTTGLQITQDFNEVFQADGNAVVAAGIVAVDFIEIK